MSRPTLIEVLPTHTLALQAEAIGRATAHLRAGQVVALPTETVYGLAANALDPAAVARVFALKDRPATNPLIVHVDSLAMARACVRNWPATATALARAFWPGPLTLVLPRAPGIPDLVTAGGDTVAVRWPSHPVIQAVIRACGFPLAAPSANQSTQVSPTTAAHVARGMGDRVSLVIDGGPCNIGIESTVVDLTGPRLVLLRPGMISGESIAAVVGEGSVRDGDTIEPGVARSPGQMPRHYAPRARLEVWTWQAQEDLGERLRRHGWSPDAVALLCHHHLPAGHGEFRRVSVIPHDPAAYARALYAELHHCDEAGVAVILVEAPPPTPEWTAIHDRLRRASAGVSP